jgi:hypothetical protein
MAKKVKVFEVRKKDKKGNTITEINIFGTSVPGPDLKAVKDDEGVVKKLKLACPAGRAERPKDKAKKKE